LRLCPSPSLVAIVPLVPLSILPLRRPPRSTPLPYTTLFRSDEAHSNTTTAAYRALEELVDAQIAARAQARKDRDWETADAIRDQLAAAGIVVEDGADGVTWSTTERN